MAETCCAEIDVDLAWHGEVSAGSLVGEKCKHKILKQPTRVLEMHIYAPCGVRGLLEENGITSNFTDVNRDFLFLKAVLVTPYGSRAAH
jgi:hypothetical protein